MRSEPPTIDDALEAHARIRDVVIDTPLVGSPALSRDAGVDVRLKLETVQPTGSFKVRGAASRILALDDTEARRGVVTASTGNHGRAVAYVASRLGIPAAVCVSDNVPQGKVASLRALGCELVVGGRSQTEAFVEAQRLVDERGMTLVHPFDDPYVIAGQATIGLEVERQAPDVETVLVPLSGGGLIAGVALAITSRLPDARVVGVCMRRGATMVASLEAGEPVEVDEEPTLADSLQGGIGMDNRYTLRMVRELVSDVVLVDEDDIWQAMVFALHEHRLVIEGAAAVGIAALRTGAVRPAGPTAVVVSGANAELDHLGALAAGEDVPPD